MNGNGNNEEGDQVVPQIMKASQPLESSTNNHDQMRNNDRYFNPVLSTESLGLHLRSDRRSQARLPVQAQQQVVVPDVDKVECCNKYCQRRHPCILPVHDGPCPPCDIKCLITYPCCGLVRVVVCMDFGVPPFDCCGNYVLIKFECGHLNRTKCSDQHSNGELIECTNPCNQLLDKDIGGCGHICQGKCSECYSGRFHVRCQTACGKPLICGHICTVPCSRFCPPCSHQCEKTCDHGKCKSACGSPCPPCHRPCTWKCPHQTCSKKCYEICDRTTCNERCPKLLSCGHPCVGFCGEICPPLCRICHKVELTEGLVFSKDKVVESDRFVYLQACGHSIEVEFLTKWMEARPENNEIIPKICPLCNTRIFNCNRFQKILKLNEDEINRVKKYIIGPADKLVNVLAKSVRILADWKVKGTVTVFKPFHGFLSRFAYHILNIQKNNVAKEVFDKVSAKYLEFGTNVLNIAETTIVKAKNEYPAEFLNELVMLYEDVMDFIMARQSPLHPNEMNDLRLEMNCVSAFAQLFDRFAHTESHTVLNLRKKPRSKAAFDKVKAILLRNERFGPTMQKQFEEALKDLDEELHCTLGITDQEKLQILEALNLNSGRWFKCPNDHIYVVTECGGVTEESVCNECGERIGGRNHHVLPSNALATEMDGAVVPLFTNYRVFADADSDDEDDVRFGLVG